LFLGGDGGVEFAGLDLFGGGLDEAEFAGGEVHFSVVAFAAHGGAESAAEDGTVLVEVAGARVQVEDRARLVVGELFEEDGGLVTLVEDSGDEVAGEPGVEAGEGVFDACVDSGGFFGVGLFEVGGAFAETCGIFVSDREDADAALGAACVTDEMMAAAAVGVGYGDVDDLDEALLHDDSAKGFALCANVHVSKSRYVALAIVAEMKGVGLAGIRYCFRE